MTAGRPFGVNAEQPRGVVAMTQDLRGKTVAVLATDGVEQVELTEPVKALKSAGAQVHSGREQFFCVEEGEGEVWIDGNRSKIEDDDAILVPAGARHNIVNTGGKPLRLYTLCAPPKHRDGTVHRTKADADASDEPFDGKTTE
jgi:mannose-6-phosphate isomerase-like protein (cupin superfamily)